MTTKYVATVLDAPDARTLSDFYRRLLDWDVEVDKPDWVILRTPAGADFQPQEHVRACFDPVGHPFCLYVH